VPPDLSCATALAAGRRPYAARCRSDYERFTELWSALHPGQIGADAIDAKLHTERLGVGNRARLFHESPDRELPDGAFVLEADGPQLVLARQLLAWSPGGYRDAQAPADERLRHRDHAPVTRLDPPQAAGRRAFRCCIRAHSRPLDVVRGRGGGVEGEIAAQVEIGGAQYQPSTLGRDTMDADLDLMLLVVYYCASHSRLFFGFRLHALAPIRQRIESIFQTCKDILTLERHGARTDSATAASACPPASPRSPPRSCSTTNSAAPAAASPATPPKPVPQVI
jgi:hypothetical protein